MPRKNPNPNRDGRNRARCPNCKGSTRERVQVTKTKKVTKTREVIRHKTETRTVNGKRVQVNVPIRVKEKYVEEVPYTETETRTCSRCGGSGTA